MNGIETILRDILIELTGNQRRQIGLGAIVHVDPVNVALKVKPRRRRPTDKLRQPIWRLKLACQNVHLPEATTDGFKRQLKLRRPLGELTLMLLVAGDVLDLRNEAYDLTLTIAHRGHVDQDVNNLSERPQVTLLDRVAVPPSLQDLLEQDQVRFDIFWMGEVHEMRPEHLPQRKR